MKNVYYVFDLIYFNSIMAKKVGINSASILQKQLLVSVGTVGLWEVSAGSGKPKLKDLAKIGSGLKATERSKPEVFVAAVKAKGFTKQTPLKEKVAAPAPHEQWGTQEVKKLAGDAVSVDVVLADEDADSSQPLSKKAFDKVVRAILMSIDKHSIAIGETPLVKLVTDAGGTTMNLPCPSDWSKGGLQETKRRLAAALAKEDANEKSLAVATVLGWPIPTDEDEQNLIFMVDHVRVLDTLVAAVNQYWNTMHKKK